MVVNSIFLYKPSIDNLIVKKEEPTLVNLLSKEYIIRNNIVTANNISSSKPLIDNLLIENQSYPQSTCYPNINLMQLRNEIPVFNFKICSLVACKNHNVFFFLFIQFVWLLSIMSFHTQSYRNFFHLYNANNTFYDILR